LKEKTNFIREVDSWGKISVLNEYFNVGKEYTDEYVWATIETRKQTLIVCYKDENLKVREINKFGYEIGVAQHFFFLRKGLWESVYACGYKKELKKYSEFICVFAIHQ
jgi:hypothetical protein